MIHLKKVFEDSPTLLLIVLAFASGLLILLRQFLNTSRKAKPLKVISRVLRKQGLDPAMIPLIQGQAIHETGNFKSNLFLVNNNLFGMKVPKTRETFNISKPGATFSVFKTQEDSVKDFVLYLDHFGFPPDLQDPFIYTQMLKDKNYFEDSVENYFKGLSNGIALLK